MTNLKNLTRNLTLALTLAFAGTAVAAPPAGNPGATKRSEAHAKRDAHEAGKPDKTERKASKAERKASKPDKAERKASKPDKAERKASKAERKASKAERKASKVPAALAQEARRHAWRMARLQRIVELATASGNDRALARARKLADKETRRHDRFLINFSKRA